MGDDMGEVKIQIYSSQDYRGPGKVLKNLQLGLNKLKIDYTVNQSPIKSAKKICLSYHNILTTPQENLFIGPNICVLPIDDSFVMNQNYEKYIVNSQWTYDAYKKWLPEQKLSIWPVGIDTDLFSDKKNNQKNNDCLIYFKRRGSEELERLKKFLEEKKQSYRIVEYGNYDEKNFIELIENSKYSIVIDNCESQGIAIQEIMSCNLPLLVWDVEFWNDRGDSLKFPASSVPFWNDKCGKKFYNYEQLNLSYDFFIDNLNKFEPRNFILENLSLDICAKNLLKIINYD
jgi:hypothetical protein